MLRGIGRFGVELALAVLAFLGGAALVRAHLPPAEGGSLDRKLAAFAAAKDEYDAVAIGSSRMASAFDPVRFRGELARAGVELRAFNLGAAGARTFEQDWILRRVLALEPARLRWIFLEGGPVGLGLLHPHAYGDVARPPQARDVQWHDLAGTHAFLRALEAVPLAPLRKLGLALQHLGLAARRLANVGRGPELVRALAAPRERRAALHRLAEAGQRDEGFQPHPEAMQEWSRIGRARIAALARANGRPVVLADLDAGLARAQVAAAAARGVELVHVTPPSGEDSAELLALHAAGSVPALLHFNDPVRFPELYEPGARHDLGHLSARGAERFTRLLAEAFLGRLGALPRPVVPRGSE
jgi:hypothetical protein